MDDYSNQLFPLFEILASIQQGNYFGFKEPKDNYLYSANDECIGTTVPLGSRHSKHYVRIYTTDKNVTSWEAELKQNKAKDLLDKLINFKTDNLQDIQQVRVLLETLKDAALDNKDFRDKSQVKSPKNTTRERTKRLPFFDKTIKTIDCTIEHQAISNYQNLA